MRTAKDGILHNRVSFSIFEDHIELYNDEVETFYYYDQFVTRLYEIIKDELKAVIHEIPKMTNARIDTILTYNNNPETYNIVYPYDIKVIKK